MNIRQFAFLLVLTGTLLTGCEDQQSQVQQAEPKEQQEEQESPVSSTLYTPEAIADNNRGVGLMGSFDYPGRLAVFEKLATAYPEVTEFQFNRAVATLNRQLEGDEEAAISQLEAILARNPATSTHNT